MNPHSILPTDSSVFWLTAGILGLVLTVGSLVVVGFVEPDRWPFKALARRQETYAFTTAVVCVLATIWTSFCFAQYQATADDPLRERLANDTGYPLEAFPERIPEDGFFALRIQGEGTANVDLVVCHYSGDTQELWCTDEGDLELAADPDGQAAAR